MYLDNHIEFQGYGLT